MNVCRAVHKSMSSYKSELFDVPQASTYFDVCSQTVGTVTALHLFGVDYPPTRQYLLFILDT